MGPSRAAPIRSKPTPQKTRKSAACSQLKPLSCSPRPLPNQQDDASDDHGDCGVPLELVFWRRQPRIFHSHVNLDGWDIHDAQFARLINSGCQATAMLTRLTLDNVAHLTSNGLSALGSFRSLVQLSLQACSGLSADTILILPTSLTQIDLSHCEWVDDASVRSLVKRCPALTHVWLAHCKRMTDYGVAAFADSPSSCAMLLQLNISHCVRVTDTALLALFVKALKLQTLLASGLPRVEGWVIQGLPHIGTNALQTLDLAHNARMQCLLIVHLVRVYATRLTDVDLSHCALLTDEALVALGQHCPSLVALKLASCAMISDNGLIRLVENSPAQQPPSGDSSIGDQQRLASDVSASSGDHEPPRCTNLRILDISGCYQITNDGLAAIARRCMDLQVLVLDGVRRVSAKSLRLLFKNCLQLRTFSWSGLLVRTTKLVDTGGTCSGFFSIPQVDQQAVSAIASGYRLTVLNLANTKCDAEALASLLVSHCGAQLTDLNVTAIATDALCLAIGSACARLQVLHLSRSRYFSESSFLAIASNCTALRVLDLESCEQIRDRSLDELSTHCVQLERLVLANDWQVTDHGVSLLCGRCKSLLNLNVRHCPEVTLHCLRLIALQNNLVQATANGLTPKSPNVLAFLRGDNVRRAAAVKITRWLAVRYRGRGHAKSALDEALRWIRRRKRSAVRIQHCFRRFFKQLKQTRLLQAAIHERDQRVNLQWDLLVRYCRLNCFLTRYSRNWVAERRRERFRKAEAEQEQREAATLSIQRVARGFLARRRTGRMRARAQFIERQRNESAMFIQRSLRGHLSRKRTAMVRTVSEMSMWGMIKQCKRVVHAAIRIQCIVRGIFGRQQAYMRALEVIALQQLRDKSAHMIQRGYRAYLARIRISRCLNNGACAMQKVFRGFRGRKQAREIVITRAYANEPRLLILQNNSIYTRQLAVGWKTKRDAGVTIAVALQCLYRGFCGRLRAGLRLAKVRQIWYTRDVSARSLQHFFRSIMILIRIKRFHDHLHLRHVSATKIQATWRMWTGKVLALACSLRRDRREKHQALVAILSSPQEQIQARLRLLQFGAVHSIAVLYRASLYARGWQSPTFVRFLNKCATRIQSLVRGHFGRQYALWYRQCMDAAARLVQRCWRGKLGKNTWRALMMQRRQQMRDQDEQDRAARIARKRSGQYGLEAMEKEAKHAVVLQRWYHTLRKRQVYAEAHKVAQVALGSRAADKLALACKLSVDSVIFQARVWRDCADNRDKLLSMQEEECAAMEQEIVELRKACLEAQTASMQAASDYQEWSQRQRCALKAKSRARIATEQLKQQIHPFAVQSKVLTLQSARVHVTNRQLQDELRRVNKGIENLHRQLRAVLPYEPLLLQDQIESLLTLVQLQGPSLVEQELLMTLNPPAEASDATIHEASAPLEPQ